MIFDDDCSRYLASRLFGKFKEKSVGEISLKDGVDGSDNVSGNDDGVVSVEISIGSFTMFDSPCVYECVAQYGSRSVGLGGYKDFHVFVQMLVLNLSNLRCYVGKGVWEFLVMYFLKFLK